MIDNGWLVDLFFDLSIMVKLVDYLIVLVIGNNKLFLRLEIIVLGMLNYWNIWMFVLLFFLLGNIYFGGILLVLILFL